MHLPRRFAFIKYKKRRYEYTLGTIDVRIPSSEYPLTTEPEVFLNENSENITEKNLLDVIDGVTYEIGRCYTNADNVAKALQIHGYKAKVYVGWMIIQTELPQHHSWVVLNNKYVIDLAADFDNLSVYMQSIEGKEKLTIDETRVLMANFIKESLLLKHSQRLELGKVSKNIMYIGCPCSREKGIEIFDKLSKKYPNHPAIIPTDSAGRTKTQQLMEKEE